MTSAPTDPSKGKLANELENEANALCRFDEHYRPGDAISLMRKAADLLRTQAALLDQAERKLGKACAALGFGHLEKKESKSGIKVQVTSDAYINLMGALDDLTNSNGNDAVTRRTIDRVVGQLAAAKNALRPPSPDEEGK